MVVTARAIRGHLISHSLAVTIVIAAALLSLYQLRDFSYSHDFARLTAIKILIPQTGWAALKILIFWAWAAMLIAAWLTRLDPSIAPFDATLAGAGGLWVIAYLAGSLLGPLGLFRGPTIWLALVIGTLSLRSTVPLRLFYRPSFGVTLAAVAVALAAVSILPLQLASPVAPFMDVLAYPASVQRILTFHTYLPFDNDPYGALGAQAADARAGTFLCLTRARRSCPSRRAG